MSPHYNANTKSCGVKFSRATTAAVNKYGLEKLTKQFHRGILCTLPGVGGKVAMELTNYLKGRWHPLYDLNDLIKGHLSSDHLKALLEWEVAGVDMTHCLDPAKLICSLHPHKSASALLRCYVNRANAIVRSTLRRGQQGAREDIRWPEFSIEKAQNDPYAYLRKNWGMCLGDTDHLALEEGWWGYESHARCCAFVCEGLEFFLKNDGHTMCATDALTQWCLEKMGRVSIPFVQAQLMRMVQNEQLVGLRERKPRNAEHRIEELAEKLPKALAYRPVLEQEKSVAIAVLDLTSTIPITLEAADNENLKAMLLMEETRAQPDDAQWRAILGLYHSSFALLQGPAGTGKTAMVLTTLVHLLRYQRPTTTCSETNSSKNAEDSVQRDGSTEEDCEEGREGALPCILGAAPTHTAVKRIREEMGEGLLDDCRTLASWLSCWGSCEHQCALAKKAMKHPSVTVIVDESSMVDLSMWDDFFKVLQELRSDDRQIRCILAGDYQQLPPVGSGAVFEDLCKSGAAPTFCLEKVYRQEARSILQTAELYTSKCPTPYWTMRNGIVSPILPHNDATVHVTKIPAASAMHYTKDQTSRQVGLTELLHALQQQEASLRMAGYGREQIQLITFTNEMCYVLQSLWDTNATDEAERLLSSADAAAAFKWKTGARCRFKKNSKSLFKNNDTGVIVEPLSEIERDLGCKGQVCVQWTAEDGAEKERTYTEWEPTDSPVKHIEPGCTKWDFRAMVHKSAIGTFEVRTIHSVQGAGFDVVMYILTYPSIHLTANGHYTAVTRARKHLCLMGDLQAFCNASARLPSRRRTLLPSLLAAIQQKPLEDLDSDIHLPARELHSAVCKAHDARRKPLPKSVRLSIWNTYIGEDVREGACYVCGTRLKLEYMHAAHVIAVATGGSNLVSNLRPCCSVCNLSMGTRNLDDFRAEFYSNHPPHISPQRKVVS